MSQQAFYETVQREQEWLESAHPQQRTTAMKSESIKELAAALAKAQGEMTGAKKDSANPFFKSKYADLASVVEAIRAPFSKHGLSYTQIVHPSDKNEVQVSTILMHSSGEWMDCGILALPVSKADAQGFGSALTYARRYALSAAVGVAAEDDDGNAAAKAAPKTPGEATAAQMASTPSHPTAGLWEDLSDDSKAFLSTIANNLIHLLAAGKPADAVAELDSHKLDADAKSALWTRLDSKQRSAIKKAIQDARAASIPLSEVA